MPKTVSFSLDGKARLESHPAIRDFSANERCVCLWNPCSLPMNSLPKIAQPINEKLAPLAPAGEVAGQDAASGRS